MVSRVYSDADGLRVAHDIPSVGIHSIDNDQIQIVFARPDSAGIQLNVDVAVPTKTRKGNAKGNAKGVSPRILTKLACMEEPDGLIW